MFYSLSQVQFALTITHTVSAWVIPCGYPIGCLQFQTFYMCTLVVLFVNFYMQVRFYTNLVNSSKLGQMTFTPYKKQKKKEIKKIPDGFLFFDLFFRKFKLEDNTTKYKTSGWHTSSNSNPTHLKNRTKFFTIT